MKKCTKCNQMVFNIEEENNVKYIICSSCGNIVGTVNAYNTEEGIEQIKAMTQEHHAGMVKVLDRIINNQVIINEKIDTLNKSK